MGRRAGAGSRQTTLAGWILHTAVYPPMENAMAKGQKRSNREVKKPKQEKKTPPPAASPFDKVSQPAKPTSGKK